MKNEHPKFGKIAQRTQKKKNGHLAHICVCLVGVLFPEQKRNSLWNNKIKTNLSTTKKSSKKKKKDF